MSLVRNPNKKQRKEKNKRKRVRALFNTGTRVHKSKRDYNRKKEKEALKNLY